MVSGKIDEDDPRFLLIDLPMFVHDHPLLLKFPDKVRIHSKARIPRQRWSSRPTTDTAPPPLMELGERMYFDYSFSPMSPLFV